MGRRRAFLAAAGGGVILLLAWWLLGSGPGAAPAPAPAPVPRTPASAPAAAPEKPPPPSGSAPASVPAPEAGSLPAALPPAAAPDLPPPGPGTITGTVVAAVVAAAPVEGVLVVLKAGEDGRTLPEAASALSGPDGTFRFDGLAPGPWCFSTRTPGSTVWDHGHENVVLDGASPGTSILYVESPVAEGKGILARGTVVFEDGTPVASFELGLRDAAGLYLAAGVDGRFERRLPGPGRYDVDSLRVEGDPGTSPSSQPVEVGEDGSVAVVLRRAKETSLLVLDAANGEPLPSARAFPMRGGWARGHHPNGETAAGAPLPADGNGVILLGSGERGNGGTEYHVVADGHAWRKITVDFSGGPPVPVLLQEGGALRLEIRRWAELQKASILLEGKERGENRELPPPDASGVVQLEGLPAGEWGLVVRSGAWWGEGLVYGRGRVAIAAGVEASVVIDAEPGTGPPPVPVTLRLSAPSGWAPRSVGVEIEGAAKENASSAQRARLTLPADGSAVSWTTPPVTPGPYHVTVEPNAYFEIVVPPEGGSVDVVLPEAVEVRVTVLDEETGKPVAAPEVMWHPASSARNSNTLENAARGTEPGECVFRAPPGRLVVWAGGAGYFRDDNVDLEVAAPGPVRREVRVRKAGTLVVRFRWEGAAPLWDDLDISFEMGHATHNFWIEEGQGERDGLPPGTGTLSVEAPAEEYEAVPDREVELRAGEKTEVEVVLVRRIR